MARMLVTLGFLGTAASLACLALAQASAPAMPTAPQISCAKVRAETNSSKTDGLMQVSGLPPLNSTPAAGAVAEVHPAAAAEELIDELPVSQGGLSFALRCCLDLAVLVFTAVRLRPGRCGATPEDDGSGAQQQSKPHHSAAWADGTAEPHLGQSSVRELLLAWDCLG